MHPPGAVLGSERESKTRAQPNLAALLDYCIGGQVDGDSLTSGRRDIPGETLACVGHRVDGIRNLGAASGGAPEQPDSLTIEEF